MAEVYYNLVMKNYTVRLPEELIAELEAESRRREVSTAEIVRERLQAYGKTEEKTSKGYELIKDLIGISEGLPADVSSRKKHYLKQGYGRKPHR